MAILGSRIMAGNEAAWIDMMLEDSSMLKQMGLPTNLTPKMKEEVKGMLLSGMTDASIVVDNDDNFEDMEPAFDESKSPAEQFVTQAMNDLGIYEEETNTSTIKLNSYQDMVVNGKYMFNFPNGDEVTVILRKILPNSFGDDYIFENIKGAENLVSKSSSIHVGNNEFPLPAPLLRSMEIFKL